MGAVIPTISSRAIEAVGLDRASLVSGIVFMCQLSGAALMLAVSTAIFSAASARDLQRSLARDGIVLAPDQRQAVQEIIAGARNVHALPLRTAAEVDDLAGIVDRAYQSGLSVVLWLSAALVLISLVLVLRFVKPARRLRRRWQRVPPNRLIGEHTDERQIAIPLVVVQTIADHKFVGNVEADVVRFDRPLAVDFLAKQNADLEA